MSMTTYDAGGRLVGFTIEDTVGFLISPEPDPKPGAAGLADYPTKRLVPPFRRPNVTGERRIVIPRTIGIVDAPLETDALPPLAAYVARPRPLAPGLLVRWTHKACHRAARPSIAERLCRLFGGAR
ncbi:hypothetical protein [Actinoplanes lobatus]|uniref:Uncharacterized protein n=1 Tax=Actinoplanes lobatus TaxID=113568 RepID=A0A7W7HRG3_9ACTN|nr:hypothetical protein [Actinoplanes lobatus]MBB4755336.1 hypothetical protein [Actinoplanes lobatus]GIE46394.1 hypothetical protein Alo02nite_92920 [Actinoplanes lobatus]